MTDTADFWRGDFGTSYTKRNRVQWEQRVPFWQSIIERTEPKTIMEVGCNAGWNLRALRFIDKGIRSLGVEINQSALQEAADAGLEVYECQAKELTLSFGHDAFDLVFTAGVLIHIAPEDIDAVMEQIIAVSKKWVVAVEYPAATETELEYRGNRDKLWKRPYGALYREHGLRIVDEFDAGDGFDSCRCWLMRKP